MDLDRRPQGGGGVLEGGVRSVADAFEEVAALGGHHVAHDRVVPHQGLHARRTVAIHHLRAALDVGEQQCQGAGGAGHVGHGR